MYDLVLHYGRSRSRIFSKYEYGSLDYGWDKLTDEVKLKKQAIELNNGRATQMGILELLTFLTTIGNIRFPLFFIPSNLAIPNGMVFK